MVVVVMSYELEFVATGADEENDGEPPPIAGLANWIPGAKTAGRAMNWVTGSLGGTGHVDNAVDFTNKNVTVTAAVTAAATGGASLIASIQGAPIAMDSFKKIAADDKLWDQYCEKLKKNKIVRCGWLAGDTLRDNIRKMTPQKTPSTFGQNKK